MSDVREFWGREGLTENAGCKTKGSSKPHRVQTQMQDMKKTDQLQDLKWKATN